MTRADTFRADHPEVFFLDLDHPQELAEYLERRGWLEAGERLTRLSRAGEGNMNLVLRVEAGARSFIVKQSRPWVEKYDVIDAPWDRARVEAAFFRAVSRDAELAAGMPALIGADDEARVILMEDLGESRDFSWTYTGGVIEFPVLDGITAWLARLHGMGVPADPDGLFANREMRALNHEHIFALPLRSGNGIDLDDLCPGLAEAARPGLANERYRSRVTELGHIYLEHDGGALLHGDYYPGSWLETEQGVRVIDPEFCFVGPREWDLGVMLAHLVFSDHPATHIDRVFEVYGPDGAFDEALALGFAGAEIMRRLLGVAQLPLGAKLEARRALLERSVALVLDGNREALR